MSDVGLPLTLEDQEIFVWRGGNYIIAEIYLHNVEILFRQAIFYCPAKDRLMWYVNLRLREYSRTYILM